MTEEIFINLDFHNFRLQITSSFIASGHKIFFRKERKGKIKNTYSEYLIGFVTLSI